MTTIIEGPSGGNDGVIAVVVGITAAAVIVMFALGAFDRQPAETNFTIETPAAAVAPTAPTAPTAPQATPADTQPAQDDPASAPPPH
jgi:hypothetical protein